jgi:hypothetical protein
MKFKGIYNQDLTLEFGDIISVDEVNNFVYISYRDFVLKAPLKKGNNLENISNANSVGFSRNFKLPKGLSWSQYRPKPVSFLDK